MFDFIRRHTKIMMVVLFLLVFPSFVLWGIQGYSHFNDGATKVAVVAGKNITQLEWDNAHRRDVDRLRAQYPKVDVSLFDTPAIKYQSLEQLVRDRVLSAAAADGHLMVSDQRLAAELARDPNIAALRRPDGTLDMEQYRTLVGRAGFSPEGYEANLRADLASNQVLGGVIASELVSPAQADVAMDAFLERREVSIQRFAPADYAAKLNPSDADLQAFYQAHLAQYQAPDSARIEYVVLDVDGIKKSVPVNEQALHDYYGQNKAALDALAERRASHILISAPKDAPAAEREKARTRATELLAQLRQAPDTFADLARKFSQDESSAPSGGDLGLFLGSKGIDPAISKAAYALAKEGDISDVVESDFGYHIVRLTSPAPTFETLRPKLEDQWRTQQAQKQFGELAETFKNKVFEQPDSLAPVAEALKLTVQTAGNVTRTPAPGAQGALADARFLKAVFSPDSLNKKLNTEAREIGPGQIASARVVQYAPAHARPLAEVQDQVRAAFINERGAALAREDGQARLKAWTAQPASATGLPAVVAVSRDAPQDQPPQLIEAVLRADPSKLPAFVGVDLGPQGYAVARVDKVLPKAEQTADAATQSRQRYEQLWAQVQANQYYEQLKARYKAAILAPNPATITLTPAAPPASAASR